jgi:hypothetical protein
MHSYGLCCTRNDRSAARANPLFRNEIVNCTISVQLRHEFCVEYLPIWKPTAGGQVIHPARLGRFSGQRSSQVPVQAAYGGTTGGAPLHATRREPRSPAALTFAVCGLSLDGRFFVELCSTVNVSRSGCCLRLRTRPQKDSALVLRAVPGGTSLPEGTSQLLFQLAWLQASDDGWLIGAYALSEIDLCGLVFPSHTP